MNTPLRNIHVPRGTLSDSSDRSDLSDSPRASALPSTGRLRRVQNDPAREFAARAGATEPLPDSIIALILHRQCREQVTRNGIRITIDGASHDFWSDNSLTIATRQGQKVLVTYNRHNLDLIHVLSDDGAYVESIPRKGEAHWFDPESATRELTKHKRAQQQTIDRLQHLHAPDAQAALQQARHNTAQIKRVVQNFDPSLNRNLNRNPNLTAASRPRSSEPSSSPADPPAPRRDTQPPFINHDAMVPEENSGRSPLGLDASDETASLPAGACRSGSSRHPGMVSEENSERRSSDSVHETPGPNFPPSLNHNRNLNLNHSVADHIQLAEYSARQQRAAHTQRQQRKAAAMRAVAPEELDALLGDGPAGSDSDPSNIEDPTSNIESAIDQLL